MILSILAVAVGGALGSLLRWLFGLRFNGLVPDLPMGTLISNLSAGYVIGLALAFFARYPDIPIEWRLFVITGILGGLSTFSTFSAEVTEHLQAGRVGWALGEIAIHVIGSVSMTALGILTVTLVIKR
ncbi:fluoride efflux transporter CrcB [Pararobbsia silviterrae]|uniref:Fluoride-specific ion channel FluC n=1 Tax=Pararobbsia silviterrae TaxID=1792498 RepID=A0A494YET4_9BURK|nr:fluoride efflux transporter CrcB [Pararobbsia silviterrae]RKP59238.1 fluoride efflux transporter CrcB [Pararobbsia silviterrae]